MRRRLALARVAPALLALYRSEEMSFEQLSAFTISDDHEEQLRVWESLPSWNRYAHSIKAALRRDAIAATDKRIRLIGGLDVYEQAGGDVKRDLFEERAHGYALDLALVERLTSEKLEALAADLRTEGWLWVEIRPEIDWQELHGFGRVYPAPIENTEDEEAELECLRQEHDQLEALIESGGGDESAEARLTEIVNRTNHLEREVYTSEDLARAGAIVSVEHNGATKIHRGYVHPEETASLDRSGSAKQNEAHARAARGLTHSASLV